MREIMRGMGLAVMGTGKAKGSNRAREAAQQAISSPLLENISIAGARGVLLNISGGLNLGLHEVSQAASIIYEQVDEDANIILGSVIDPNLDEEVMVTVIATGFNVPEKEVEQAIKVQGSVVDTLHNAGTTEAILVEKILQEKKQESMQVQHKQEQVQRARGVDMQDLDVPTFLRKQTTNQPHE